MFTDENNFTDDKEEKENEQEEETPTLEQFRELQKQLLEKDEKLKKLQDKDLNFKRWRNLTKEEKEKLDEKEKELLQWRDQLEEKTENLYTLQTEGIKNDALYMLAGEDKDAREKILYHYERLKDEATTKEQILNKMKDAAQLAGVGKNVSINPLTQALGYQGRAPEARKGNFVETTDGKNLATKLNIKI